MLGLMVVLLLQSAPQPALPIGVSAELLARNLPAPKDADDLDQPITSYSVLDDRPGSSSPTTLSSPTAGSTICASGRSTSARGHGARRRSRNRSAPS